MIVIDIVLRDMPRALPPFCLIVIFAFARLLSGLLCFRFRHAADADTIFAMPPLLFRHFLLMTPVLFISPSPIFSRFYYSMPPIRFVYFIFFADISLFMRRHFSASSPPTPSPMFFAIFHC